MANRSTIVWAEFFGIEFIWNSSGLIQLELIEKTEKPNDSLLPLKYLDLRTALEGYFDKGTPLSASDIFPLLSEEVITSFQREVYRAVLEIPLGETRTYKWVATKIGRPGGARAVGQALRYNPYPVLIPCHRVISERSLGGFLGRTDPDQFEMRIKMYLLRIEHDYRNPVFPFLSTDRLASAIAI